jgi:hypothetical protein
MSHESAHKTGAGKVKTKKAKPNQLEGEGSYTAARRYREGVAKTVKEGGVAEAAERAAEALDGPEGEALRAAEEKAKRGKPTSH